MRVVSAALKRILYPSLASTGILRMRRGAGNSPAVITYHGILPDSYVTRDVALDGALVGAASFRRQLRLLKSHYSLVTPQQFLAWREEEETLPPRSMLLTCDDGLANVLTTMMPILVEEQVTCLFFVTGASVSDTPSMLWYEELYLMMLGSQKPVDTEKLDIRLDSCIPQNKRAIWVELLKKLSSYDHRQRRDLMDGVREQLGLPECWKNALLQDNGYRERFLLMDLAGLLALTSAGMTVGAHTISHPVLSRQPPDIAYNEIAGSKAILEDAIGNSVWAIAYPFGDPASVGDRELKLAQQAGFRMGFMNAGGGFGADMPSFAIPRMHVGRDMGTGEFEAHLAGFHRRLQEMFAGRNSAAA